MAKDFVVENMTLTTAATNLVTSVGTKCRKLLLSANLRFASSMVGVTVTITIYDSAGSSFLVLGTFDPGAVTYYVVNPLTVTITDGLVLPKDYYVVFSWTGPAPSDGTAFWEIPDVR